MTWAPLSRLKPRTSRHFPLCLAFRVTNPSPASSILQFWLGPFSQFHWMTSVPLSGLTSQTSRHLLLCLAERVENGPLANGLAGSASTRTTDQVTQYFELPPQPQLESVPG